MPALVQGSRTEHGQIVLQSTPSEMTPRKQLAQAVLAQKPTCFISYSTKEPYVNLVIEAAYIVFSSDYEIRVTPSALTSGASQLDEITKSIKNCAFAVIVLDGLRPNVVFEYGLAHGLEKPVILLKEADAEVDVQGFFKDTATLKLVPVSIDLDSQFSDVKDRNYVKWNRYSLKETCDILHAEFLKKKDEIQPFLQIEAPKLW